MDEKNWNDTPIDKESPRELRRTHEGRMIAGVCSGAGKYLGVDANIIRVVLAIFTFFSFGLGIAVYAIGWLLIPEEGQDTSVAQDLINKSKSS